MGREGFKYDGHVQVLDELKQLQSNVRASAAMQVKTVCGADDVTMVITLSHCHDIGSRAHDSTMTH